MCKNTNFNKTIGLPRQATNCRASFCLCCAPTQFYCLGKENWAAGFREMLRPWLRWQCLKSPNWWPSTGSTAAERLFPCPFNIWAMNVRTDYMDWFLGLEIKHCIYVPNQEVGRCLNLMVSTTVFIAFSLFSLPKLTLLFLTLFQSLTVLILHSFPFCSQLHSLFSLLYLLFLMNSLYFCLKRFMLGVIPQITYIPTQDSNVSLNHLAY